MMYRLRSAFFTGLAALLPLVLTCYLLYWAVWQAEHLLGGLAGRLLPSGWYVPGLGLLLTLALVLLAGMLVQLWGIKQLKTWGESLLQRIPLVRTVFGTISDFVAFLSPRAAEPPLSRAVLIDFGNHRKAIGLITRADATDLFPQADEAIIGVYLPMSYQVGGYTLYLPRSQVTELDLSAQEAMRLAVTAGVSAGAAPNKHK